MASSPVTEHEVAPSSPVPTATGGSSLRGALSVAAVLLLVGALAWLIFGFATGDFVDADAQRVVERNKILADRNAEDAKLLHDPVSWQTKDKGIVRVPIERAIDLAMSDLRKVSPHPAYPLTQSPPQPANAPAAAGVAAASPAAAASASASPAAPVAATPLPAAAAAAPSPATPIAPPASADTPPSAPAPAPAASPTASAPAAGPAGTP